MTYYELIEETPGLNGKDEQRLVQVFDRQKSAEHVLNALENVNDDFHSYKILILEPKPT